LDGSASISHQRQRSAFSQGSSLTTATGRLSSANCRLLQGLTRASRRRCIIFKAIISHMLLGRLTIELTSNIMGGKVQCQIGRAISLKRNL
ncbi:hypothetical protein E4U19_000244, partial [Claviceps sp. Clav32 group G5]